MTIYTLHFDGSCGPKNPGGTAAYGYTITHGKEISTAHGVIGTGPLMSNNLAEFTALGQGLQDFLAHGYNRRDALLNVRGDSQLVINIMGRRWKPKPESLYWPAYQWTDSLLRQIRRSGTAVNFDWIPREQNQECDNLSKM